MKLKKICCFTLCAVLFANFLDNRKVKAIDPTATCLLVTTGITAIGFIWSIAKDGLTVALNYNEERKLRTAIEKYKGLRSRAETTELVKDIINGHSQIKIYGQENAKRQIMTAISGCLENIYGNPSERTGNVVYMIGSSGVGKTTMAKALANAFLKHQNKTCIFISSSDINNEQSLGDQLFKTTTKAVNLKRDKNWKNLFGTLDLRDNGGGSYDIRVATPILEHIFKYYEAVVILDEYDKMKSACKPPDAPEEYEDRSADEILKSIAERAEYIVE